ncbi:recombinase zinc beta ribbon domain-containing protein [Patescibacteria group bacterium]|nr:recombinase zinc beta ribbon domain-containing protein [Patescibacteria group bacterium]
MITRDEYEEVQRLIRRKDVSRPSKHVFAYSNIIKCSHCGFSICGTRRIKTYKRTGRTAEYAYYRCSHMNKSKKCDQPPVNESKLFEQFLSLFSEIQIDKDFLEWANQYYDEVYEYEQKQEKAVDVTIQESIRAIEKKLDNLLDTKVSGLISDVEFSKKRLELSNEKENLEKHITSSDNWRVKTKKCFDVAYLASEKFKKALPEEQKSMIREINSDLFLDKGKIRPVLEKPYFLFQKMKTNKKELNDQFGLMKENFLKPQTINSALQSPLMYPVPDSNRRFSG